VKSHLQQAESQFNALLVKYLSEVFSDNIDKNPISEDSTIVIFSLILNLKAFSLNSTGNVEMINGLPQLLKSELEKSANSSLKMGSILCVVKSIADSFVETMFTSGVQDQGNSISIEIVHMQLEVLAGLENFLVGLKRRGISQIFATNADLTKLSFPRTQPVSLFECD